MWIRSDELGSCLRCQGWHRLQSHHRGQPTQLSSCCTGRCCKETGMQTRQQQLLKQSVPVATNLPMAALCAKYLPSSTSSTGNWPKGSAAFRSPLLRHSSKVSLLSCRQKQQATNGLQLGVYHKWHQRRYAHQGAAEASLSDRWKLQSEACLGCMNVSCVPRTPFQRC
jgi:hypothetical protein